VKKVITEDQINEQVESIAKHVLGFDTLETRKSDRLDFKTVSVWDVRMALEAAYRRGANDAGYKFFE
jgi:hypothetical protein